MREIRITNVRKANIEGWLPETQLLFVEARSYI